jgi:hypothetical protein
MIPVDCILRLGPEADVIFDSCIKSAGGGLDGFIIWMNS